MTTTEATSAERLAWLEAEITKLTTRRQRLDEQLSGRSLKSDFGKLAAVREEYAAVVSELGLLQDERDDVAEVVAEEQRITQQHQSAVVAARAQYDAMTPALVEAVRSIHFGRMRLIDLGEPDPGDKLISVESIAAPILHRDERAAAITAEMFTRDRASPEQVAAMRERQQLVEQLHIVARPWAEAEQLADAVLSGKLTLQQALESVNQEDSNEVLI